MLHHTYCYVFFLNRPNLNTKVKMDLWGFGERGMKQDTGIVLFLVSFFLVCRGSIVDFPCRSTGTTAVLC